MLGPAWGMVNLIVEGPGTLCEDEYPSSSLVTLDIATESIGAGVVLLVLARLSDASSS